MPKCIPFEGLTEEAKKLLPNLLDESGYQGKYAIHSGEMLVVRGNSNKIREEINALFCKAEQLAKNEKGYYITVRRVTDETTWVPADSLRDAMRKAFDDAKSEDEANGNSNIGYGIACPTQWPVVFRPETYVRE